MGRNSMSWAFPLFLMIFLGIALVSGSNASHQMTTKSDKSLLLVNGAVTASTTGDIYSGSGNWVINQSTTYIDEVLTVYGNISINFPGSLTLVNTTINFEEETCPWTGAHAGSQACRSRRARQGLKGTAGG
ncbi:MAG: hypothetical protein ACP6IT_06270 [Candidatus Thorarchaeota archaeon]